MQPSVLLRTQGECYLFNVPEGASRFLPFLHVTPNKLHDFFFTRGCWDCLGGLGGLLMSKDATDRVPVRLHGPSNVAQYLSTIRPFMDHDYGAAKFNCTVEERTLNDQRFEDSTLTVDYIPVFERPRSADTRADPYESQNLHTHTSFLVRLKPKDRRVDPFKLIEKKVPKGPLIGQLKAGKTVTLPNGETVTPDEVLSDQEPDFASALLLVDCEAEERINSLVINSTLKVCFLLFSCSI